MGPRRLRRLTLAVLILPLLSASEASAGSRPASNGDWRQDAFDAGHSNFNSEESILTPFHVRHLRRVWSFHSAWPIPSPPVVVGHRVFAVAQGEDGRGAVYGLDASTGGRIWTQTMDCPLGSPALVQGLLVIGIDCLGNATGGIASIEALRPFTGETVWCCRRGSASSLTVEHKAMFGVEGDDINFRSDEHVVRYDPSNGDAVWTFGGHRVGRTFTGTAAARRRVYVVNRLDGSLYELSARSGKLRLRMQDAGTSAPVVVDGVAYLVNGGELRAIDLSTQSVLWSVPRGSGPVPHIAVANGRIFVNSSTTLSAYDAATGVLLWSDPHPARSYDRVTVANGVVYADSGSFRSSYVGVFGASAGEQLHAPVPGYGAIVANGLVYTWGTRGIRAYGCACLSHP